MPVPFALGVEAVPETEAVGGSQRLEGRSPGIGIVLPGKAVLRRQLNVLLALAALVLAAPAMLVIAAAIRLLSSGPVLDREVHIGLDRRLPLWEPDRWRRNTDCGGRPFVLYRFRTTRRPSPGTPHLRGDRGTAAWRGVAGFMKRWHLDGLPQLFNVLRRDMNVVGPSPETPAEVAARRSELQSFARRQRILPGMTGPAQIEELRRSEPLPPQERLAHDLRYVGNSTAMGDLRIVLTALAVLVRGEATGR